jgi:hypothetical protein
VRFGRSQCHQVDLGAKDGLQFSLDPPEPKQTHVRRQVGDITDRVNVSRRTSSTYFSSEEEAIASLNADRFARAGRLPGERRQPAGQRLGFRRVLPRSFRSR